MFVIKYLKSILYIFIYIILFSIIIGSLSYFNILGNTAVKIFELLAIIISMFIGSMYLGKHSNKKGYLEGLKIGLLMILLLFSFNFLGYDNSLSLTNLIFYGIILLSSIFGSVIGINKKSS